MTPRETESDVTVRIAAAVEFEALLPNLTSILHACVHDGASVGFILPFDKAGALNFWRESLEPGLLAGSKHLLIAQVGHETVGTVILDCGTMPNQPHRADVSKLLVHPDFRRKGIARMLMLALEGLASEMGRTTLTLDTRPGDGADTLYKSLGFQVVGNIPNFCVDTLSPRLDPTTIMYKLL